MKGRATLLAWRWEGARISPHHGGVPLDDRGFRYGQHLFESVAVRDGSILLGREHLGLLAEAAARNGFPFPRALATALRSFFKVQKLADGMLRIYLTAGPGTPGSAILKPGCFLTWEATRFPTQAELAKGYGLLALKEPVAGIGWGEKSGNYAEHLTALSVARAAGADDRPGSVGGGRQGAGDGQHLLADGQGRPEKDVARQADGGDAGGKRLQRRSLGQRARRPGARRRHAKRAHRHARVLGKDSGRGRVGVCQWAQRRWRV